MVHSGLISRIDINVNGESCSNPTASIALDTTWDVVGAATRMLRTILMKAASGVQDEEDESEAQNLQPKRRKNSLPRSRKTSATTFQERPLEGGQCGSQACSCEWPQVLATFQLRLLHRLETQEPVQVPSQKTRCYSRIEVQQRGLPSWLKEITTIHPPSPSFSRLPSCLLSIDLGVNSS